jgi:hypothetical protein
MSNWDWAERFFSKDDIYELEEKSKQLIYDNENGLIVNIPLSNEQCMQLVEKFYDTLDPLSEETMESHEYIEEFLLNFIAFVENYLDVEHDGWHERRNSIDE